MNVCLCHVCMLAAVVLRHMYLTCFVAHGRGLCTDCMSSIVMQQVSVRKDVCPRSVFVCEWLGMWRCSTFLPDGRMVDFDVLHHMWLTCCVAPGCRRTIDGPSSMRLKAVSVL